MRFLSHCTAIKVQGRVVNLVHWPPVVKVWE